MDFKKIDLYKYKLFLYKTRYVYYGLFFIGMMVVIFNSIANKKENFYNKIAEYENISFLIKNGKPKTKTLNENYIRTVFSKANIDYIKYVNGTYNVKASNVNINTLANIVYQIEDDGFKINFLKAQDYTGEQDFDIHMEISP